MCSPGGIVSVSDVSPKESATMQLDGLESALMSRCRDDGSAFDCKRASG